MPIYTTTVGAVEDRETLENGELSADDRSQERTQEEDATAVFLDRGSYI